MFRTSIVIFAIGLLLLTSCTSGTQQTESPGEEVQPADVQDDAATTEDEALPGTPTEEPVLTTMDESGEGIHAAGTVTDSGVVTPVDSGTEDDQIMYAMELLQIGDEETALRILEGIYQAGSEREDLPRFLSRAHSQYAESIRGNREVRAEFLNEVLYSHLMRILEFEPENEEAQAGLMVVMGWYERQEIAPPDPIDPLAFLPPDEPGEEEAIEETDESEDGSTSTTDDGLTHTDS